MSTIDANTGLLLTGVGEVYQSLACIFETPKGSRIMRRLFGADRAAFQDKGIAQQRLVDFYAEIAAATKAEPRVRVTTIRLSEDSDVGNGHAVFDYSCIYYPKGHLGDYSEAQTVDGTFLWSDPGAA